MAGVAAIQCAPVTAALRAECTRSFAAGAAGACVATKEWLDDQRAQYLAMADVEAEVRRTVYDRVVRRKAHCHVEAHSRWVRRHWLQHLSIRALRRCAERRGKTGTGVED